MSEPFEYQTNPMTRPRGEAVLAQLTAAGIGLPGELTDALGHIATLDAHRKAQPDPLATRARLVALVDADPDGDHQTAALVTEASHRLRLAYLEAVDQARRRLDGLLLGHVDALVRAIGEHIFEPAAEALATAAEATGPADTSASLLRDGRTDDATALAAAGPAADQVDQAHRLRSVLYRAESTGRHTVWENPDEVPAARGDQSNVERYMAGLRAGGRLWFATLAEVEAAAAAARIDEAS